MLQCLPHCHATSIILSTNDLRQRHRITPAPKKFLAAPGISSSHPLLPPALWNCSPRFHSQPAMAGSHHRRVQVGSSPAACTRHFLFLRCHSHYFQSSVPLYGGTMIILSAYRARGYSLCSEQIHTLPLTSLNLITTIRPTRRILVWKQWRPLVRCIPSRLPNRYRRVSRVLAPRPRASRCAPVATASP